MNISVKEDSKIELQANQSINKNLTKVRVGLLSLVSCVCTRCAAVPTCTLRVQPLLGKLSIVLNNTLIYSVVLGSLDGTTTPCGRYRRRHKKRFR